MDKSFTLCMPVNVLFISTLIYKLSNHPWLGLTMGLFSLSSTGRIIIIFFYLTFGIVIRLLVFFCLNKAAFSLIKPFGRPHLTNYYCPVGWLPLFSSAA